MARRTLYLRVIIVVAVLVACAAALLVVSQKAEAAFPGLNGRIAFSSNRDGDSEIYKMFPDGSNQKQVTYNNTSDTNPTWSPDGNMIAFQRGRSSTRVFVKDMRTRQVVRLTDNAGNSSGDAAWSPDGTKIAFNRDYDIWVMDADGTHRVNLTNSPTLSEYSPDWSPDGTKIAFTNGSASDIFVMNADGSGKVNLTNTPGVSDDSPAWSPNGRKSPTQSHLTTSGQSTPTVRT